MNPIKLIVELESNTKLFQIEKFLQSGLRIFRIQLACVTKVKLDQLILRFQTAIANYRYEIPVITSLVYELRGHTPRLGQMRCEKIIKLFRKEMIVLTTNRTYESCSVREVLYVSNFQQNLEHLKTGDVIFVGGLKTKMLVIKVIGCNVTCIMLTSCKIRSFMKVITPYLFEPGEQLTSDETDDLEYAVKNFGDFIIVSEPDCAKHNKSLKSFVKGTVMG